MFTWQEELHVSDRIVLTQEMFPRAAHSEKSSVQWFAFSTLSEFVIVAIVWGFRNQEDPMEVAMKLLQHDRLAKQERRQRESQVSRSSLRKHDLGSLQQVLHLKNRQD